jgi:hypothetical protein
MDTGPAPKRAHLGMTGECCSARLALAKRSGALACKRCFFACQCVAREIQVAENA